MKKITIIICGVIAAATLYFVSCEAYEPAISESAFLQTDLYAERYQLTQEECEAIIRQCTEQINLNHADATWYFERSCAYIIKGMIQSFYCTHFISPPSTQLYSFVYG